MAQHIEIESQAAIIDELERFAKFIYYRMEGDRVGVPAVTVGIQSRGKKAELCGFTSFDTWTTKEGKPVHEITVTSEHLAQPVNEVLATIAHECVHLFNHDRDEKDCSKGGRHNGVFAAVAQKWHLEVSSSPAKGPAHTKPTAAFDKLVKEFDPKLEVFRIFREQVQSKPRKEPVKKIQPWVCDCGTTVQVAIKVELKAHCTDCDTDFRLKTKEVPASTLMPKWFDGGLI